MRDYMGESKCVVERSRHNFTNYRLAGCGLTIKHINGEQSGYMLSWELVVDGRVFTGSTVDEFIRILNGFKRKYKLKTYSNYKKDKVIIYTDNLRKFYGFFYKYLQTKFKLYVILCDYFEVRQCWKDLETAKEIAEYARFLIDNIFVPEKYFYLTEPQIIRKRIDRHRDSDVAHEVFSDTYHNYKYIINAVNGGLCYIKWKDHIYNERIVSFDLKSAYIYCMLCLLNCISGGIALDPDDWNNTELLTIGTYEIEFYCNTNIVSCFKDVDDNEIEKTEKLQKRTFVLTNIDRDIILKHCEIVSIKCSRLIGYEKGRLPKYLLDAVVEEFIKKEQLTGEERVLQKRIVNSIYGAMLRKINNRDEWKERYNHNPSLAPQWGIFILSFCKQLILEVALQLDGWYYTDTDSIYCKDTPENRKIIDDFNMKVRMNTMELCREYGYNFEKLIFIGNFIEEHKIKKLRTIKQKVYMFMTVDNEYIVKAAGCNTKNLPKGKWLFRLKKIPVGKKYYDFIVYTPSKETINGVEYSNESGYFGFYLNDKDAEIMDAYKIIYKTKIL